MDAERMSPWLFDTLGTGAMAASLAAHLVAGLGLGFVYFNAVWRSARLYAEGGRPAAAIALAVGRFLVLGGLLALASLEGAWPLLAVAGGVLLGRPLAMRRCLEAAP
jgi:hypothetical protein